MHEIIIDSYSKECFLNVTSVIFNVIKRTGQASTVHINTICKLSYVYTDNVHPNLALGRVLTY